MAETAAQETKAEERPQAKRLIGMVVSNKMDKTIVVEVQRLIRHRVYKKYIRRRKKVYAHDEQNTAGIGDKVEVAEITRPLSKTKRWRLTRVIERAK